MKLMHIIVLGMTMFLFSCESSINRFTQDATGNDTYTSTELGSFSNVLEGKILAIKKVTISGSKGLGSGIGAVVGGTTAAAQYDSDAGQTNAAALGSVLGAVVGKFVEENVTQDVGYEFLVRLTNGKIKAVVQVGEHDLRVGDEVFIITGGGNVRLTRK